MLSLLLMCYHRHRHLVYLHNMLKVDYELSLCQSPRQSLLTHPLATTTVTTTTTIITITATTAQGSFAAKAVFLIDGMVPLLSHWAFSDVFEEQGWTWDVFNGGFGLVNRWGVRKPVFNVFKLLNEAGSERFNVTRSVRSTRPTFLKKKRSFSFFFFFFSFYFRVAQRLLIILCPHSLTRSLTITCFFQVRALITHT
jgi:hypothetical protein